MCGLFEGNAPVLVKKDQRKVFSLTFFLSCDLYHLTGVTQTQSVLCHDAQMIRTGWVQILYCGCGLCPWNC